MQRRFAQLDVFSAVPFLGNPVAVVLDGEGLTTEEMQAITRWTNLSEATFLMPPTTSAADYRVRIFTQSRELPFAGHPTLGSCRAWLDAGGTPTGTDIVQECGAGLVPIRRDGELLAFAAPPTTRSGPVSEEDLAYVCDVLRLERSAVVDAAWTDNGPGWVSLLLSSAEAVLDVTPRVALDRETDIGLVGFHPPGGDVAVEVRGLFTDEQHVLREDPVTGSLNAAVAQWLIAGGRAEAPWVAAQGAVLGRAGRVHVSTDADDQVWVGGATTVVVSGTIEA